METNQELQELIESLRGIQNAALISHLKAVFEDIVAAEQAPLTEQQKRMLDDRIERHKQGEVKTYSLEEVRARFQT